METMTVSNQQSGMTKRSVSNFFATLFSELLDEQVSPRQARAIINAIIAFFAIIISSAAPIWASFAALVWFVAALRNCRRLLPQQQQ
jgi:hypothetical protein